MVLQPSADGSFEVPRVEANSNRPQNLINLSPPGTDAKNGLVYQNDAGEIVLKTRINGLSDISPGTYGEQVFVFKSWGEFTEYQAHWGNWRELLAAGSKGEALPPAADGRAQPIRAHVSATEASFPEGYNEAQLKQRSTTDAAGVTHTSGYRGFGPGARPIRLEREGNQLFASEGRNAPRTRVGEIPAAQLKTFPIPDGQTKLLTADHQLRTLEIDVDGQTVPKRVYSMAFRLWNAEGDRPELIYSDAAQPVSADARGGGILDLQHVYPVGWAFGEKGADGSSSVAVWAGAADANTKRYAFDIAKLLGEMSSDSPRRQKLPGKNAAQVSALDESGALKA